MCDNSIYNYDISLGEDGVIVARDVNGDFMDFKITFNIDNFVKPFIDFYIEQKNIQKFFEEMKIFYK